MLLFSFLDSLIDRGPEKKSGISPEMYTAESLRRILQEERARSNRSRNEFSFVRFSLKSMAGNEKAISHFIRIISDRIRAIDKMGWLDAHSVGIVLPSTSSDGAQALADDIIRMQNRPDFTVDYTVYTYPFNMFGE